MNSLVATMMLYAMVPLLQKGINFFLLPLYSRVITPEDYGALAYVTALTSFMNIVWALGLDAAFALATRVQKAWKHNAQEIAGNSLRGAIILVGIGYAISYLLLISFHTTLQKYPALLTVGMGAGLLRYLMGFSMAKLQMLEQPKNFARIAAADVIMTAIGTLILILVFNMGVLGIAIMQLAVPLLLSPMLLRIVAQELRTPFSKPVFMEALAYSFPLIFHDLAAWGLALADRVMLERMADLSRLGIYSMAAQLSSAVMFITVSANKAYSPYFLRAHGSEPANVRKVQIALFSLFLITAVLFIALLPWIFRWFVGVRFAEAALSAKILVVGVMFHGFYYIPVNYLFLRKKTHRIAVATTSAFVLNILLNLIFIPKYQEVGAAIATAISYFFLFGFILLQKLMTDKADAQPTQ